MIDQSSSNAPPFHVWVLTALFLMLALAAFAVAFTMVDDPFQWLLAANDLPGIG